MTSTTSTSVSHLPDFLEPLLAQQYGKSDVETIMHGYSCQRPVTLRANTLLATRDEVADALDAANLKWSPVNWYDDAFIVDDVRENALWDLPLYKDGKVYLQSLSSMIPALVLDGHAGEDICDMCAAPGGKTTQIVALTGGKAFLTACEMHAPRAEKLEYNLAKLGASNVTVMRIDARRMDDFFSFNRVLLDAPCSGSGTLQAANPKTQRHFTEKLIEKSRKSQAALLDKALRIVKPGGCVVYSTCSVLACENEEIVTHCLKRAHKVGAFELEPVSLPDPTLPRLPSAIDEALCLAPTDLYEGFFIAKIKRTG